jgi:hypothetical protein
MQTNMHLHCVYIMVIKQSSGYKRVLQKYVTICSDNECIMERDAHVNVLMLIK